MIILLLIRTFIDGIYQEHSLLLTKRFSIVHTRLDTAYILCTVRSLYIIASSQVIRFRLDSCTPEISSIVRTHGIGSVVLLGDRNLTVFIIGVSTCLLSCIHKGPVLIIPFRITGDRILGGIRSVLYITFGNEATTQILRITFVIQIQLQQIQVRSRSIHFLPTIIVYLNVQTSHSAISTIVFQFCTTYGKNGFRVIFRSKLRVDFIIITPK